MKINQIIDFMDIFTFLTTYSDLWLGNVFSAMIESIVSFNKREYTINIYFIYVYKQLNNISNSAF